MYHTKLAADPNMKKEGRGSLLVTVEPKSNVPWYDVGAMRRLNAAKATMISFWIRFDDTPKPVWIQLIGGKESAVMRFRPEEFGIVRGEWKLVELPGIVVPLQAGTRCCNGYPRSRNLPGNRKREMRIPD